MRQARTVLSTYSSDTFGVCSALYELGGMTVMHDASGCNSTYSTHDEPRWYHSQSLVFISGLTEIDAIMGNDEKLKNDMLAAIRELHPKFAAIVGTPIPMMTGFDFEAVAAELEREAGIPCFGFSANGMRSYLCGASEALQAFAKRMTDRNAEKRRGTVNILGATPLDFSINGTVDSIKKLLAADGWEVIACWAMGSALDELIRAGEAEVNLVISGSGVKTARVLKELFGTPCVIGTPVGEKFSREILKTLRACAADGADRTAFSAFVSEPDSRAVIIGESVVSRSLAAAAGLEYGAVPRVISTLEPLPELEGVLSAGDAPALGEEEIQEACAGAAVAVADPLYKPVLPGECRLIPLPHEAFSGRMFRKDIPDLTKMKI